MRVLLVGDVHGRHAELAGLLGRARAAWGIEAAIQTGDFGFDAGCFSVLERAGARFAVPVYAVDGNHEDHRWLHRAVRSGAAAGWRERFNLHYLPRTSVIEIGGRPVGFLGGALHVDRSQYRHWFRRIANFIMSHERARAEHLFNDRQPGLVVTHSCPTEIGIGIRGSADHAHGVLAHVVLAGFEPVRADDYGEHELTRLWRHLRYRPAAWAFGHFHVSLHTSVGGTRFVCCAALGPGAPCPEARLFVWDSDFGALSAEGG